MNCKEMENILLGALYDEIDGNQRAGFDQHLAQCPTCRAEYESLKETMNCLDRYVDIKQPFQLSQFTTKPNPSNRLWSKTMITIKPILVGSAAAILMFGILRVGELTMTGMNDVQRPSSQTAQEMEKFILLLFEDRNSEAAMNPDEEQRLVQEYSQWAGSLAQAGKLAGGEKLKNEWSRVLVGHDREFSMREGYQTRDREMISGFFEILAKSYDEAMDIAKTCPHLKHNGRIELRWIDPV